MTETQLRAKIDYCVKLRGKHERLGEYFDDKLDELRADLIRMLSPVWMKYGPDCVNFDIPHQ